MPRPFTPHYFPRYIQEKRNLEQAEMQKMASAFGVPRPRTAYRHQDKQLIGLQSLAALKQSQKNLSEDFEADEDIITDDKFQAQLCKFNELPPQAHERIRDLGNEILACYAVQLCKFLNDSLIETTPNSFAVFSKKNRTGQRWLMVFRHDRGRVSVKYNKLLTNQLLVKSLNQVSVEVEPTRGAHGSAQETCVFTFTSHSEANKFLQDIFESQRIAWNHREVLLEQSLKNEQTIESPCHYGFCSPRPMSAYSTGYMPPVDIAMPLTPRTIKLSPSAMNRQKRSPFTVSVRTPEADIDENWRSRDSISNRCDTKVDYQSMAMPVSATNSPIRKRSRGAKNKAHVSGGDGDFIYNSLTHSVAMQQPETVLTDTKTSENTDKSPKKDTATSTSQDFKRFLVMEILVSNKRDVGTGAPDEEFFPLGAGEIQLVNNGEAQFDEVKFYASDGELLFSHTLYSWNKVRHTSAKSNLCWWIGAAVIGKQNSATSRIREFKAKFTDETDASEFCRYFEEGSKKGNNPEVRRRYLAQSLRV